MEEWKKIQEFPDYEVSTEGRIKSYKGKTPKLLKPAEFSNGYLGVLLYNSKTKKSCLIHRLVLETFKPIENMEFLQVNHIDFNRKNNKIENLEWTTPKENRDYRDYHKHTPKAESILVQFLDEREDLIFDSMTACANYFNISRKAINKYLSTQNIRKDRKVQAHFYKLGRTNEINNFIQTYHV